MFIKGNINGELVNLDNVRTVVLIEVDLLEGISTSGLPEEVTHILFCDDTIVSTYESEEDALHSMRVLENNLGAVSV